MFYAWIRNMTLALRVGILATIFLLPLGLVTYYLTIEKLNLLNFAALEREGARALEPAHRLLAALAVPAPDAQTVAARAAALEAASAESANAFDLRAEAAAAASAAASGDTAGALEKTAALIVEIADASNLSHDPEPDGAYLTRAVVRDAPPVLLKAVALRDAPARDAAAAAVARAGFAEAAQDLKAAIDKAIAASGAEGTELSGTRDAFVAANGRLIAAAERGAQAGIETAAQAVAETGGAFLVAADKALEALIGARIDGYYELFLTRMAAVAALLLLAAAFSIFTAQSVLRPVRAMTAAMGKLARGDMAARIPAVGRRDEIGEMAKTVQVFKDRMIEAQKLREAQQMEEQHQLERAKRVEAAVAAFQEQVGAVVSAVDRAANDLRNTAEAMAMTAEETEQQSTMVASASQQATQNVQTVAAATEQLSATIREIGGQAGESTRITSEAVTQAGSADGKVQGLTRAVEKIGEVVSLINDIAGQTNLLALNATIEAARAGEMGKGFAVVASEVKNLATQTAHATDEVDGQIKAIQEATQISGHEIQMIGATIRKVNEIATGIAAAMEEQDAATSEIARNVTEAAQGTSEVSNNISGVKDAARQTGMSTQEVLAAIENLTENSQTLKKEVEAFLREVRAA